MAGTSFEAARFAVNVIGPVLLVGFVGVLSLPHAAAIIKAAATAASRFMIPSIFSFPTVRLKPGPRQYLWARDRGCGIPLEPRSRPARRISQSQPRIPHRGPKKPVREPENRSWPRERPH